MPASQRAVHLTPRSSALPSAANAGLHARTWQQFEPEAGAGLATHDVPVSGELSAVLGVPAVPPYWSGCVSGLELGLELGILLCVLG